MARLTIAVTIPALLGAVAEEHAPDQGGEILGRVLSEAGVSPDSLGGSS